MKLGRVFRKYVPFVLIAILIACLFSKPQREGMKKLFPKQNKKNNPFTKIGKGIAAGVSSKIGLDALKHAGKMAGRNINKSITNSKWSGHVAEDLQSKPQEIRQTLNHPEEIGPEVEEHIEHEDLEKDIKYAVDNPEEIIIEDGPFAEE